MTFPVHYRAELDGPGDETHKDVFLSLMPMELRAIGLGNVFVQGGRISFGRGAPRYFSDWNLLTALDRGEINVLSNNGRLTVTYDLSFTGFFVLMAVLFLIGVVAWATLAHGSISSVTVATVILFVWLLLMGLSCWHVARKLGGVIKTVLARSA